MDRASQCPAWDDEQTFGLPVAGARALVYGNPWFSVQAEVCTGIISFPYTPSGCDPSGPRISLNHPQTAPIRKTVPFRTSDTSAGPLIYAGRKRKLNAWAADNGRLLREEFYQAAQRLAEQIVERVFAG